MSQKLQFDRLAQKAYRAYHQDGLLDLLIGCMILSLSIGFSGSLTEYWAILGLVPIVLYGPLKKRITIPRLGYVRFPPNPNREVLLKVVYPLLFCTFIVIGLFGMEVPEGTPLPFDVWTPGEVWPHFQNWLQEKEPLIIGLATVIVFVVVGLATAMRRMFVYALLSMIALVEGWLIGFRTYIPMFVLGGIILFGSAVMLISFLRKYPITSEEELTTKEQMNHAAR